MESRHEDDIGNRTGAGGPLVVRGQGGFQVGDLRGGAQDAAGGGVDIEVGGAVEIGFLDLADNGVGGNPGKAGAIKAAMITIGDIDAAGERDGEFAASNGSVSLTALGPPDFDATSSVNNSAAKNIITLTGTAKMTGFNNFNQVDSPGGLLTVSAIKIVLGSEFDLQLSTNLDNPGEATFVAGNASGLYSEADLFMNMSNELITPMFLNAHPVGHRVPEPAALLLCLIGNLGLANRRIARRQ